MIPLLSRPHPRSPHLQMLAPNKMLSGLCDSPADSMLQPPFVPSHWSHVQSQYHVPLSASVMTLLLP